MSTGTGSEPPFIGSKINLISKAEIRYEGYLYAIDTERTTVTLSTVRSFGTEDRKAPKFVKPREEVYEYIIFRGTDIKDLHVSEGPSQTAKSKTNLDDPAIIQSGHGGTPTTSQTYSQFPTGRTGYPPVSRYNAFGGLPPYGSYPMGFQQQGFGDPPIAPMHPAAQMISGSVIPPRIPTPPMQSLSRSLTPSPETVMPVRPPGASELKMQQTQVKATSQAGTQTTQRKKPSSKPSSRRNSAELDTQAGQGAKSDKKENEDKEASKNTTGEKNQKPKEGGNRRSRGRRGSRQGGPMKFEGDFDFESSNARFKKEDIEEELHTKLGLNLNLNEDEDKEKSVGVDIKDHVETLSPTVYYDKEKSFFDSISCEANDRDKNRKAHPSWAEERKLNVETFGVSGGMRLGGRGRGGRGGRGGYRGRGGRGGGRGGRGRGGWNSGGRGYRGGRSNRGWVNYMHESSGGRSDTSGSSSVSGPSARPIQPSAKA